MRSRLSVSCTRFGYLSLKRPNLALVRGQGVRTRHEQADSSTPAAHEESRSLHNLDRFSLRVHSYSSAARGVLGRGGTAQIHDLETRTQRIQMAVETGCDLWRSGSVADTHPRDVKHNVGGFWTWMQMQMGAGMEDGCRWVHTTPALGQARLETSSLCFQRQHLQLDLGAPGSATHSFSSSF